MKKVCRCKLCSDGIVMKLENDNSIPICLKCESKLK